MTRRAGGLVLFAALALGCARGDPPPDGSLDGGQLRRDAGDSGIRRDSGPGSCDPRGYGATCPEASEIAPLAPGDRFESELGLVPRAAAQWLRVSFPPVPPPDPPDAGAVDASGAPDAGDAGPPVVSAAGGGSPAIRFLRNDGDVYRIEIRTACVGVASCGEGGTGTPGAATELTEWTYYDDPGTSAAGAGQFSVRDVVWPETVYVRVYPRSDPACGSYQIEITR